MSERDAFNREVRRAALLTVALVAALVFGVVLLAGGDWIPGTVIVVATVAGLAQQIPVINRLCSGGPPGRAT